MGSFWKEGYVSNPNFFGKGSSLETCEKVFASFWIRIFFLFWFHFHHQLVVIVVARNTVWHLYFSETSYFGPVPVHGIRFCMLLIAFVLAILRVVKMCKAEKTSKNTQGKYWISYIRCKVMGNPVRKITFHYKSSLHHHAHTHTCVNV